MTEIERLTPGRRGILVAGFLNAVNGLFVDPAGARSLTAMLTRFVGARLALAEVVYQSKRLVMTKPRSEKERAAIHAWWRATNHGPGMVANTSAAALRGETGRKRHDGA